jgi:hypothetical protein
MSGKPYLVQYTGTHAYVQIGCVSPGSRTHAVQHVKVFFGIRKGFQHSRILFLDGIRNLGLKLGTGLEKRERWSDRQIRNGGSITVNEFRILQKGSRQNGKLPLAVF